MGGPPKSKATAHSLLRFTFAAVPAFPLNRGCGTPIFENISLELSLRGVDLNRHPTEGDLEAYVMRTLPRAETGSLELHLFLCLLCRDRLAEADAFVTATRAAAAEDLNLVESEKTRLPRFTLPPP